MKVWNARNRPAHRFFVALALVLAGVTLVVVTALATLPRYPFDDQGRVLPVREYGLPLPWLVAAPVCSGGYANYCTGFFYRVDWTPLFADLAFYMSAGYLLYEVFLKRALFHAPEPSSCVPV